LNKDVIKREKLNFKGKNADKVILIGKNVTVHPEVKEVHPEILDVQLK
jgi:hypothetical protein